MLVVAGAIQERGDRMITNQATITIYAECYAIERNPMYLTDIEYLLNEYPWQSYQRGY